MKEIGQKQLDKEALAVDSRSVWEKPVLEVLGADGTAGAKPTAISEAVVVGIS